MSGPRPPPPRANRFIFDGIKKADRGQRTGSRFREQHSFFIMDEAVQKKVSYVDLKERTA